MNYYMAVINDLGVRDETFTAREIAKRLFRNNMWLFSTRTPKLKALAVGDKIVVYAAGQGNRCFMGCFSLASTPTLMKTVPEELVSLARWYSLGCEIEEANLWRRPKPILELLPQLSFIADKKNYGLYLRQGLRAIPKADFEAIAWAKCGSTVGPGQAELT